MNGTPNDRDALNAADDRVAAEAALWLHNGGVTHDACAECDRLWDELAAAWQRVWRERGLVR